TSAEQPLRRVRGPSGVRRCAAILVLSSGIAHGDETTSLREGLTRDPTEPMLHLDIDTALRSNVEGFEADVKTEHVDLDIGPRTRARVESTAWTSPLFSSEGWSASLRIVHDFKVVQVGVEAGYHRVDSASTRGSYRMVGVSLTRVQKLSKWMTAWLSLSVGQRKWLGEHGPPPGEADDTAFMLSLGTTFR
ncbi:MAG TPA: hypothetical protein VIV11_25400, partial [Kofleriaceae bacterium]